MYIQLHHIDQFLVRMNTIYWYYIMMNIMRQMNYSLQMEKSIHYKGLRDMLEIIFSAKLQTNLQKIVQRIIQKDLRQVYRQSRVWASKNQYSKVLVKSHMERVMGIGPTLSAWKAGVLPLNYTRNLVGTFNYTIFIKYVNTFFKNILIQCLLPYFSFNSNKSFPTPHIGHLKSSGNSSP